MTHLTVCMCVQTRGGNKRGVLTVGYIVCVPRVVIYSVSIEMFTVPLSCVVLRSYEGVAV